MNRQQAERNIALAVALESGKYKQGGGRLRDGDGFCCIGVACDLVDPLGWESSGRDKYLFDGAHYTAPKSVQILYGWESDNPILPGFDGESANSAAELNDDGRSFAEIARGFRALAAQEMEEVSL